MKIRRDIKKLVPLAGLALAALFVTNLTGCDLLGVSIEKRIEYFLDDLSNNRSNAITNFHPTETADYGVISTNTAFWDIDFPAGSYTLVSLDDTNYLSVYATVNGPSSFGVGGTDELEFIMIADGSNWLIEELWYWGEDVIVE